MTPQKSLSACLREGTRSAHRAVEELAFLRAFLRGLVDKESYGRYLIDLEHVYTHLEASLNARQTHPMVRPIALPMLWRQQALRADIAFLLPREPKRSAPSAPARRYGDRLRLLGEQRPELLIAHAYTRYMGDLSGGPILRRIAARALGLGASGGLAFYDFPQIEDLASFKLAYRERIDSLAVDDALLGEVIDEALLAFALNGAILDALSGSVVVSLWKLVRSPMTAIVDR